MPPPRNIPEQEHSIKERSHQLFFEETDVSSRATKPFAAYLKETPARPNSLVLKALFWIVGAIVAILFFAAIWRVAHRPVKRPRAEAAAGAATAMTPIDRRGRADVRPAA
jgi:hypothetical protein